MNIGHIDGNYYVSPQLSPDQMEEIANLGFVSIICNRPDFEVTDSIGSSVIGEFAKNLGIEFHILELTSEAMSAENAEKQRSLFQKAKSQPSEPSPPQIITSYTSCPQTQRSDTAWNTKTALSLR